MPKPKRWIVTTSADRPMKAIVKDLEAAGFSIGRINDVIGSISGAASDDAVGKMKTVPGVVDVSPDAPIDIGPPDSKKTW
jgi:hypothetical protein